MAWHWAGWSVYSGGLILTVGVEFLQSTLAFPALPGHRSWQITVCLIFSTLLAFRFVEWA